MRLRRTWINCILCAAIYPVLAGEYCVQALGLDVRSQWFAELMVGIIMIMRMFNFASLERVNMLLTILSLLPSIFFFGYTFQYADPHAWGDKSGVYNCTTIAANGSIVISNDDDFYVPSTGECKVPLQLGSLMSFALWLWSGFFNIGLLFRPARIFPSSIMHFQVAFCSLRRLFFFTRIRFQAHLPAKFTIRASRFRSPCSS